jgi:hypothetical protein
VTAWYEDKGLAILVKQEKDNHPGMVVGEIGDAKHQNEVSDHNPDPDGSVDAADFMIGSAFTKADAESLFQSLLHFRDQRISYVIHNGRIFSSTVVPWTLRVYTGSDPHTGHVHVSVNDLHHTDLTQWKLEIVREYTFVVMSGHMPILQAGDQDQAGGIAYIRRIQKYIAVPDDGVWGKETTAAMKAYGFNGKTFEHDDWSKVFGMW